MDVIEFGGLFASLTGQSEEEIKSRLNQITQDAKENEADPKDGIAEFLEEAFSAKFKNISEQQLNRGIRESRESLERKLRQKYELSTNSKGEDLIEEIIEIQKQKALSSANNKLEELSVEQLKSLPQVQEMIKPWVSKYEEAQQQFEQFKNDINQREHSSKVRNAIRNEFISLNPILPTDQIKKEKAIDAFVNSFDPSRFAITEDGIKPLNDSGNTLQDDKYNEVRLRDFISANNYFDVHKADPNKSSPSLNTAQPLQAKSANSQFASREDLLKYMNNPSISTEKKRAAYEAWTLQNNK